MYHAEDAQEDFLVLSGECLLIVEGQERRLKAWDFVHCPPMTEHVFVGAGDGPCVVVGTGARRKGRALLYAVNETALKYGAGSRRRPPSRASPTRASPRTGPSPARRSSRRLISRSARP